MSFRICLSSDSSATNRFSVPFFFLQFLESFGLIHLQTAVLFPPAVEVLHRDLGFFTGLWGGFPVRNPDFNLSQHRHDLLGLVSLDRHDQLSSKWIFSHSTWYKKSPVTSVAKGSG